MLNFVTQDHMTPYPMMDNYVQVNVGNAADKVSARRLGEPAERALRVAEHGTGLAAVARCTAKLRGLRRLGSTSYEAALSYRE